jgi:hypothetical protein
MVTTAFRGGPYLWNGLPLDLGALEGWIQRTVNDVSLSKELWGDGALSVLQPWKGVL